MNIKKLCLSGLLSIGLLGLNESVIADSYQPGQLMQEAASEDDVDSLQTVIDSAEDGDGNYYVGEGVLYIYDDGSYALSTSEGTIVQTADGTAYIDGYTGEVLMDTGSLADALIGLGSILLVPLACTAADIWYYDETSETNPELFCLTYEAAPYDGDATYCWNDGNVGTCS